MKTITDLIDELILLRIDQQAYKGFATSKHERIKQLKGLIHSRIEKELEKPRKVLL